MAERIFNCPDCGVEVRTMYPRTLRCKVCAEKKRRETRNNWKGRKSPPTEAEMLRRAARAEAGVAYVECKHCSAMMGRYHKGGRTDHDGFWTHFESKEEAIEAWNRRAENG